MGAFLIILPCRLLKYANVPTPGNSQLLLLINYCVLRFVLFFTMKRTVLAGSQFATKSSFNKLF